MPDIDIIIAQSVLSTDQLAAIGCIAVESAYLEDTVETIIYNLSGLTREKGEIFIDKFMLDSKLNLLKELSIIKFKSKKRKLFLSELIGEIKSANSERIIAIHGLWTQDINALLSGHGAKAMRSNSRRPASLSAHKLEDVAKRISDGHYELCMYFQKFLIPK